jgi:MFS transporter, YNFM family, putative membrane transport protein
VEAREGPHRLSPVSHRIEVSVTARPDAPRQRDDIPDDTLRATAGKEPVADGADVSRLDRRRLAGITATNLGAAVAFTAMYATQPVLPQIGRDFVVGPASAGLTLLAVTFGLAFASVVAGQLADRYGSRRVMLVSSVALAALCYLVAAAPAFWLLVALRAAQGLVIPGITVAGLAYLHNDLPARWRGRVSGFYIAANTVGGLIGRLGVGLSVQAIGWRGGLLLVAFAVTVGTIVLFAGMPRRPARAIAAAERDPPMAHAPIGQIVRRLWWAPLIGGTVFFPFLTVFTYTPYRLENPPFILAASLTSLVYLVYIPGAIASPLAGQASDRIGRRPTIWTGLALTLLGLILSALNLLPLAIVALGLVCVGSLSAHVVANASVSDSANSLGAQARATALSLYTLGFYIGGGLGSYIPGFGWERFGWPGVLAPCALAVLCAALVARKTPTRTREEAHVSSPLGVP